MKSRSRTRPWILSVGSLIVVSALGFVLLDPALFVPAATGQTTPVELKPEATTPGARWVRITEARGRVVENLEPSSFIVSENSFSVTQMRDGVMQTSKIAWDTPPEQVAEGEEFRLRAATVTGNGPSIGSTWFTFDPKVKSSGVDTASSERQIDEFKHRFSYFGRGYEYLFIALVGYDDASRHKKLEIRWDYKREVGPAAKTKPAYNAMATVADSDGKIGLRDLRYAEVSYDIKPDQEIFPNHEITTDRESHIALYLPDGHGLNILELTRVNTNELLDADGRKQIEFYIKRGHIEVIAPSKATANATAPKLIIKTDTAEVKPRKTAFKVSFDDQSQITSVDVAEGEVEVIPTNATLRPMVLGANQRVDISQSQIGSITSVSSNGSNQKSSRRKYAYIILAVVGVLLVLAWLGRRKPAASR